jgi:hypothetical protein
MTPFHRVAVAVVAFAGTATLAAAQAPSNVLNKLDVQKLVAAETPVASLTLAVHFDALADQFIAEANGHRAMAAAYRASANRSAVPAASVHCERLAERATGAAATTRELATFHRNLAAGRPVVVPRGAAAFQGGYGAPEPNADQLRKLAMTARTRSDHLALAEYYAGVARRNTAEARRHGSAATGYRAGVHKGLYEPAAGRERLAALARRAARRATESAGLHTVLANIG